MSELKCSSCGSLAKQYPGLYYMDIFYKSNCHSCDNQLFYCSSCTASKTKTCFICIRDNKIKTIISGN
jgi:hypothetical protein